MIIKTILVGFLLDFVAVDKLQKPAWYYTHYNSVTFVAWGTLTSDGPGKYAVQWDTRHPISWANYLKAREAMAKTPVPYGVASCHGPSSTCAGSAWSA